MRYIFSLVLLLSILLTMWFQAQAANIEKLEDLPPEEVTRRLMLLVEIIDVDNDKSIEKKELESWILKSLQEESFQEDYEKFDEDDTDTTNLLSWKEYVKSEYGDIPHYDKLALHEAHILYKAADKDDDDNLSKDEFIVFMHPDVDPEMGTRVLQQALKEKDSNQDGVISYAEFVNIGDINLTEDWAQYEKERFETELDKNSDGTLSNKEIITWIIPAGYDEDAKEEANLLLKNVDKNEDGILSFEEVLNNVDEFIDSEATSFGDHLTNVHRFNDEL